MTKEETIEIWEEKFLPHIEDYEDIEYYIDPEVKGCKSVYSVRIPYDDTIRLFKFTDKEFRNGYKVVVISSIVPLRVDGYLIHLNFFHK